MNQVEHTKIDYMMITVIALYIIIFFLQLLLHAF
jgi:hypothetical protein